MRSRAGHVAVVSGALAALLAGCGQDGRVYFEQEELQPPLAVKPEGWILEEREQELGPPPPGHPRIIGAVVPDWTPEPFEGRGGGLSWASVGPRPIASEYWSGEGNAAGRVVCIAPHPTDPATAYAVSASGGLWKTTDGGASWTPLTDQLSTLNGGAAAVHPANPNLVLLGTGEMPTGSTGDGLFRSQNAGITWARYGPQLPAGSDSVRQIDAGLTSVTVATDGGIWKSSNGGAWQPVGQGVGADKLNAAVQTLLSPIPGTTLAGVVGGVFRSTDGMSTWKPSSNGLPLGVTVWSLEKFQYLPTMIYAATSQGAYVSLDNGASWGPVTNGLPTSTNILRIIPDPESPGNLWYALTSGAGIYRTKTAGLLWEPVNDGLGSLQTRSMLLLPVGASSSDIVVGTTNGVYTSIDQGDTWQSVSNDGIDPHTAVWGLSTIPGVALALTAGVQGGGVAYRIMTPPVNAAVPTVSPSSSLHVGDTLHATTGTWDGTKRITYAYQWQRCSPGCTDIADATSADYTLVPADLAKTVRVKVTARNAVSLPGVLTSAYSAQTGTIAANPASLPGASVRNNPTITGDDGTPQIGEVLTAHHNTWLPAPVDPSGYAYQWFRCDTSGAGCEPAGGRVASPSHTIVKDDVGHTLRVKAYGTIANIGTAESDLGPQTSEVLPNQATMKTPPAIVGKPWIGRKVIGAIGSYSDPLYWHYVTWQVCDTKTCASHFDVAFNEDAYVPVSGYKGKYLRLKVEIDVNDAKTPQPATHYSKVVGPITAAPAHVGLVKKPAITGIAKKGKTLVATPGTWKGAPTFAYRWLRCNASGGACVPTATKAKTFKLTAKDVGHRMVVRVTATNAWPGGVTAQSAPSARVKA